MLGILLPVSLDFSRTCRLRSRHRRNI